MLHNRLLGGGSDGGDLEMLEVLAGDAQFPKAIPHRFDAVRAGQDQPVVGLEVLQGVVERQECAGLTNFNKGNLDHTCAQAAKTGRKAARLMTSASDKNTGACERIFFVGLHRQVSGLVSGNAISGCAGNLPLTSLFVAGETGAPRPSTGYWQPATGFPET